MAELSPVRKYIQEAEVKYKAAISEVTGRKLGQMLNFLGRRLHETKKFQLDGPYYIIDSPQLGVDGLIPFEFDVEVFNVWMYNLVPGSSGTTELDVKLITGPGDTGTTIFTTTPKIDYTAPVNAYIGIGGTVTGCVAPVLLSTPFNIDAGQALILDKVQAMPDAENCGLLIHYRPRKTVPTYSRAMAIAITNGNVVVNSGGGAIAANQTIFTAPANRKTILELKGMVATTLGASGTIGFRIEKQSSFNSTWSTDGTSWAMSIGTAGVGQMVSLTADATNRKVLLDSGRVDGAADGAATAGGNMRIVLYPGDRIRTTGGSTGDGANYRLEYVTEQYLSA